MKFIILILTTILAIVYIRVQTNEVAKSLYVEGCLDSSIKLRVAGKEIEAKYIERFCEARRLSLEEYMLPF